MNVRIARFSVVKIVAILDLAAFLVIASFNEPGNEENVKRKNRLFSFLEGSTMVAPNKKALSDCSLSA